ncbi:hypothetical protein B566_EDAN012522 [Ephemera danica]|nr:hypothetical protein B566_EDAN012522 [Ephemera danica]
MGSKPFPGRVTGLAIAGDLLVASDDAGVLTLATMLGDTTCVIWDVSALSGFSAVTPVTQVVASVGAATGNSASGAPPGGGSFLIVPVHTLYGHDQPVTCVSLSTELDLAVSGSQDGTVNVHTVQEGRYIRTLRPQDEGLQLEQERHAVHVFSVNGRALGSKPFPGRVTGLTIAGDLLVASDDAGVLTLATMLGLRPVYDLPLHVPVQSVVVTQGSSHLLVPLRDGRLMVLGLPGPSALF